MIHELKTTPEYFEAVFKGQKTFEVRYNDRGFEIGDTLSLREYEPSAQALRIDPDYVVMGIKPTGL